MSGIVQARTSSHYSSASQRAGGRRVTTHDQHEAVVGGIIGLPNGTNLGTARDNVLAALGQANPGDLSHSLNDTFSGASGKPTLFVYPVVARGTGQFVVVGAFVTKSDYEDNTAETGFRVDDLTGGGALAKMSASLTEDCVSYEIETKPKVDIIVSFDASGSMSNEQDELTQPDPNTGLTFSEELAQMLDNANLDWRVGVTSVDCSGIQSDSDLSQEYRNLWPSAGGWFDTSMICQNNPIIGGSNGRLVDNSFVSAGPGAGQDIAGKIMDVDDSNSEYTFTMGAAAIDRALPRTAGDPTKIRPDAAVVLIVVTDENEELFEETLDWLGSAGETLNSAQRSELDTEIQPWIDYLLGDDIRATVFGIYNPPGVQCGSSGEIAHAMAGVVGATGGTGGSVCQTSITNTLADIADATAGIASGLRLRGVPAPQTVQVKHASVQQGTVSQMTRSRSDGFDYDSIVNRVAFYGSSRPQTNDRVIIPYLRWENSVTTCQSDDDCPSEQKLVCIDGECR